jgi:hypothetical protein
MAKWDIHIAWSAADVEDACAHVPPVRRRILLDVVLHGHRQLTKLERTHISLARRKDFGGEFPWTPPAGIGWCTACFEYGALYGAGTICPPCKLARGRAIYAADPEYKLAHNRRWAANNPERHAELTRDWQCRNKELLKARRQADEAANPEKYKRRRRKSNNMRRSRLGRTVPQSWVRRTDHDDSLCYWCGSGDVAHVDHVMPISLGGPATESNEVPSCADCNLRKSAKHPLVWISELIERA